MEDRIPVKTMRFHGIHLLWLGETRPCGFNRRTIESMRNQGIKKTMIIVQICIPQFSQPNKSIHAN